MAFFTDPCLVNPADPNCVAPAGGGEPVNPGSATSETVIKCSDACTVTLVHEFSLPPLQITPEQGASIAGSILVVWAVGWGIRQLLRTINQSGANSGDSNE
jgi:hypothetical protein